MKAFLSAMLFGFLQAFLLYLTVKGANRGKKGIVLLFSSLIFLSIGAAIWLMIFKFFSYIPNMLCGFLAGLPLSGIIIYILCTFVKKKKRVRRKRKG